MKYDYKKMLKGIIKYSGGDFKKVIGRVFKKKK